MFFKNDETQIWKEYQDGITYQNVVGLLTETEVAHHLYEHDQWFDVESDDLDLPTKNIITRDVDYMVGNICKNNMTMNFTPFEYMGEDVKEAEIACELLTKYSRRQWERLKMESLKWDCVFDAAKAGDSYIFFPDNNSAQVIDRTNIFFADEQNLNIQQQKYILISERKLIDDIKKEAKRNKLSKTEINNIVADSDTTRQLGKNAKFEVSGNDKCISVLKMWVDEAGFHYTRSTRLVVYQPEVVIKDLHMYPIVNYIWMKKKGSSRGIGICTAMRDNQIEINRLLARMDIVTKMSAFPTMVYNENVIDDPDKLQEIGAKIAVNRAEGLDVKGMVNYITAAGIGTDAYNMLSELTKGTKESHGSTDAALGQINPEEASGASILAARGQQEITLNPQSASYKQFLEDIAKVWWNLWIAFNPNGFSVYDENTKTVLPISADLLRQLQINVNIEISPTDSFTKAVKNKSLESLYAKNAITLDDLLELSDDESSPLPVAQLKALIKKKAGGVPTNEVPQMSVGNVYQG